MAECGTVPQDAVFVIDALAPRLGMAKAADELAHTLGANVRLLVVSLSGPPGVYENADAISMQVRKGFKGRLASLRRLRHLVETVDAPLVAVGTWSFLTLALATLGQKKRIVLWEHTMLPWRIMHQRPIAAAALLLALASRRVSHVVAVSQATARAVAWLVPGDRPISVIPNLVASSPSRPLAPSERGDRAAVRGCVRLVGLGSLTKLKNWDLAIRAMRYLPDEYVLTIAGEGPERPQLERMVENLGLSGRVSLPGFVTEGSRLIAAADVVVHPSLAETFGYVLMEAADSARPIVTIDRPAMNEFVPRAVCGTIARRESPESFAEAVQAAASGSFDYVSADRARDSLFAPEEIVEAWCGVFRKDQVGSVRATHFRYRHRSIA